MLSSLLLLAGGVLASAPPAQVDWFQGPLTSALGTASHQNKPLAIYFWAPGSAHCARFFGESLEAPEAASTLSDFVCLSADVSQGAGAELLRRYSVATVPTLLILGEQGQPEDGVVGFAPAPVLVSELSRILAGTDTVSDLEARIRSAQGEAQLQLMLQLALKLDPLGQRGEHDRWLQEIRRRDPKGETSVGARLAFWALRDEAEAAWVASGDPADLRLEPVRKWIERAGHPAVRSEAWQWLASHHERRGESQLARAALSEAWNDAPLPQRPELGMRFVFACWDRRRDLSSAEKKRALEVARDVQAAATQAAQGTDPATWTEEQGLGVGRAEGVLALGLALNGKIREAKPFLERARTWAASDGDLLRRLAEMSP